MRKRIQFVFFFLQTFLERHKREIIISSLSGFLTTLFFIQVYPVYKELLGRTHQRIGVIGAFNQTSLPLFIQNQISLGLTSLTPGGEPGPSLASSWEVNGKGIIYIFRLVKNLVWSDGKKFTVKDIQYHIKDVSFAPIDDYTLQVTLKEPYAPLPVLLAQPLFRPNLAGLGAYKVMKLTYSGDTISELVLEGKERNLPLKTYKFYSTTGEALLAFKAGEVDILHNVPDIGNLKEWKGVKITEVTLYDRFVGIFLNLKNGVLKEKEIRQALAYAVPKFPNVEKAFTPISPLSWGYSQKIRLYNFDEDTARKILAKSPLASSSNELTLSTYASLLQRAQEIAESWKRAGVAVKVKVETSIPDDYQAFLLTQAIPHDPDQYQFWQSLQEVTNITHYSNPKIDKLLEDGRKTFDLEARKKIYADFQRYLVDDSPVLFLYYPKVYTVERK